VKVRDVSVTSAVAWCSDTLGADVSTVHEKEDARPGSELPYMSTPYTENTLVPSGSSDSDLLS